MKMPESIRNNRFALEANNVFIIATKIDQQLSLLTFYSSLQQIHYLFSIKNPQHGLHLGSIFAPNISRLL